MSDLQKAQFEPWKPLIARINPPMAGAALFIERAATASDFSGEAVCVISTLNDQESVTPLDLTNAALLVNAPALLNKANALLHLHLCDQEGLASGQPSVADWMKAVNDLAGVIVACETPLDMQEIRENYWNK